MRKLFATLLVLILIVGMIPVTVHALSCADGDHDWNAVGVCKNIECQAKCEHEVYTVKKHDCVNGGYDTKICSICPYKGPLNTTNHAPTTHTYVGGVCKDCGAAEIICTEHVYAAGSGITCTICGVECTHPNRTIKYGFCTDKSKYNTDWCPDCKTAFDIVPVSGTHDIVEGVCTRCGYEEQPDCEHAWYWVDGKCTKCGAVCDHEGCGTEVVYGHCDDPAAYETTRCARCKKTLGFVPVSGEHDMEDGVCTKCGYEVDEDCEHEFNPVTSLCKKCGFKCVAHDEEVIPGNCEDPNAYNTTRCKICKKVLKTEKVSGEHDMEDGVCTKCGHEEDPDCEHEWDPVSAICDKCGASCDHDETEKIFGQCNDPDAYNTTRCKTCKKVLDLEPVSGKHTMVWGKCIVCGYEIDFTCEHDWDRVSGLCKICGAECFHPEDKIVITHADCEGVGYVTTMCGVCKKVLDLKPVPGKHEFKDGVCINCGAEDPNYVPPCPDKPERPERPEKPVKPNKPHKPIWKPEWDDVPNTGDNAVVAMGIMTGAAVLSAAGIVVILSKKRRAV